MNFETGYRMSEASCGELGGYGGGSRGKTTLPAWTAGEYTRRLKASAPDLTYDVRNLELHSRAMRA
jgi:hypothetical protein